MTNYTTPSDNSDGTDDSTDSDESATKQTIPDGGIIVAGDDAELIDADDSRVEGPLPEFNKYGNYTGENYYRCSNCNTEAMRSEDLDNCCGVAR